MPTEPLVRAIEGFAQDIFDTVREPLLVLDTGLRVLSANRAFYRVFGVTPGDTEGRSVFALGSGQWDVPGLRTLLLEIIPRDRVFNDFEVSGDFPGLGRRVMLLNARKLYRPGNHTELLVLAMEDVTERRQSEADRAEDYRREHRLAAALQEALLLMPPPDVFPGLSVATAYEAAGDEALVGGDFCDAFTVEEDQVALVVGDVMGKGLAAAVHTAKVKYALRAFLREYPDPAQALERLNAFLFDAQRWDGQGVDTLVCLGLALVRPADGAVTAALAGLEPPLFLRADGLADTVSAPGLPLGVAPKAEYVSVSATLGVGDTLLLTTDGLTEARRGRAFLGSDGLERLARSAATLPTLEATCRSILDGARAFSRGPLADDACLLLARRSQTSLTR